MAEQGAQDKPDQPEKQDKQEKPAEEPKPRKRRRVSPFGWVVIAIVLAGLLFGGSVLWGYLSSYEDTDDAQIDGDIYAITSRIAGTVKAVYVQDNQAVKAGQLLVELDPRDYDVSVNQAKASLNESQTQVEAVRPNVPITSVQTETSVTNDVQGVAAAQAEVASAERDYESALADIREAEADSVKAQADLARYQMLVAKDEISRQQFDQAQAAAKSAAAKVESKRATAEANARNVDAAKARLEQAQTRVADARRTRPQQIALQNAAVKARQASAAREQTLLDQAMLNLSYTKIVAPIDGVIGKKNAEPGQQVSPGQQLMSDVPVSNLWVTANFKETQLKKMRVNQRVTIHVDAYDRDYEGFVESLAGASGARFSLLPPENATGNYVKVVQRLPIRIRIKEGEDKDHLLRAGMSAEPKVWLDK